MNLTETPTVVEFPESHYVYVEKGAPIQQNAQAAWQALHAGVEQISKGSKISGYMSLYRIEPDVIYRAGVVVDRMPENLPPAFHYMKFEGGKYARFVLKGSYAQLPEACGRVFKFVEETKMPVRAAFNIENYVNDPRTTAEAELLTEILVPTK